MYSHSQMSPLLKQALWTRHSGSMGFTWLQGGVRTSWQNLVAAVFAPRCSLLLLSDLSAWDAAFVEWIRLLLLEVRLRSRPTSSRVWLGLTGCDDRCHRGGSYSFSAVVCAVVASILMAIVSGDFSSSARLYRRLKVSTGSTGVAAASSLKHWIQSLCRAGAVPGDDPWFLQDECLDGVLEALGLVVTPSGVLRVKNSVDPQQLQAPIPEVAWRGSMTAEEWAACVKGKPAALAVLDMVALGESSAVSVDSVGPPEAVCGSRSGEWYRASGEWAPAKTLCVSGVEVLGATGLACMPPVCVVIKCDGGISRTFNARQDLLRPSEVHLDSISPGKVTRSASMHTRWAHVITEAPHLDRTLSFLRHRDAQGPGQELWSCHTPCRTPVWSSSCRCRVISSNGAKGSRGSLWLGQMAAL